MGDAEGCLDLAALAAIGERREGKAASALEQLVEQVYLHLGAAAERVELELERLKGDAGSAGAGAGPETPAGTEALALELQARSLAAIGPRAAKAHAVAYSFRLVCVTVLVLVELVIALFLFLERDRLLAPRLDVGTVLSYAFALQFLLIPFALRWLERKLIWETYDSVCADLTAGLRGISERLER